MVQITSHDAGGTTVTVSQRPDVASVIAGGLLFLLGAGIVGVDSYLAIRAKEALHTTHLILGSVVCVAGIVIAYAQAIPRLKQLSVVIWPYVPILGGKRAGDPPSDPPSGGAP